MSSDRLIKRRIKSAKNISQITKAMEMVSASKMKRSQDQALASRPYAEKLATMLQSVAVRTDPSVHPLLRQNDSNKALLVIFSSDRGLAGSLNTNLFKAIDEFSAEHTQFAVIVIGKKAKDFAQKMGYEVVAEFTNLPEKLGFDDTLPIAELVMKEFLAGAFESVHTVHMRFITTLSQKVELTQLLPFSYSQVEHPEELITAKAEYTFEPSPKEILQFIIPYYVETVMYQMLLDAKASEHSARMVAMKNASDNAKEVVSELQLMYNKSRQSSITNELIDMTTASLSLA